MPFNMISFIYKIYIVSILCCSTKASEDESNLIQNKDDYCKITKNHTLCQFQVSNIAQYQNRAFIFFNIPVNVALNDNQLQNS